MRLEGKVAVVTGGARGIGRAIAERYVAEGACVAIADIGGAADTAQALGDNAMHVDLDITRQDSIDAMVAAVVARFGRIDILVNNAGIFEMAPLADVKPGDFDRVFNVNVKGLLFTLQAATNQMVRQGDGGKVINIASQAGRRGEPMIAVYCATKASVISITQSCGLELIKKGINVNCIAPGVVDTPMWDVVDALHAKYSGLEIGQKKREVGENVPHGRMGTPEDHAGAAVFLGCDDSDYVVGQTLNVDGGQYMN